MKKTFLMLALIAAGMSSCSNNELMENTVSKKAVGFNSYVGNMTRATEKSTFGNGDVFNVNAYFTENADLKDVSSTDLQNFMINQKVVCNGTDWAYSPIKYWPNDDGDKVSFFAVSDGTNTKVPFKTMATEGDDKNKPSFSYTNPATATAQEDLMVASLLNQKENAEKLNFQFKHILSEIVLNAKTAGDYSENGKTVVTITKIKVDYNDATKNKGTFTFDNETENTGTWVISTTGTDMQTDETFTDDKLEGNGVITSTQTKEIIAPIMLIPQDLSTNTATVTITYEVKTTDSVNDENSSKVENTAFFKINKNLLQSTKYIYNISVSLTDVKVSGTIDGTWGQEAFDVNVVNSTETTPTKGN